MIHSNNSAIADLDKKTQQLHHLFTPDVILVFLGEVRSHL